jgi:hypothetical protein
MKGVRGSLARVTPGPPDRLGDDMSDVNAPVSPGPEPSAAEPSSHQVPTGLEKACGILLALLGWGSLVCLGLLTYVICTFDSPPFDLRELGKLKLGMSRAEVRAVLGSPEHVYPARPDDPGVGESWSYSRPFSWPIVYVYFDSEGRFREHRYDH